jgi:hypothetical protein
VAPRRVRVEHVRRNVPPLQPREKNLKNALLRRAVQHRQALDVEAPLGHVQPHGAGLDVKREEVEDLAVKLDFMWLKIKDFVQFLCYLLLFYFGYLKYRFI